jgi:adenylate cyclase
MEYSILALHLVNQTANSLVKPILAGAPHHVVRGFLLLVTGAVTGLVTIQIKKRILNSFVTIQERNRIRRTFGEYVAPVVMDKLLTFRPHLRTEQSVASSFVYSVESPVFYRSGCEYL